MARPIAGIHPFGPPFRMQQGRTPRAPAYEAPVQSIKDDESSVKKLSKLALDRPRAKQKCSKFDENGD